MSATYVHMTVIDMIAFNIESLLGNRISEKNKDIIAKNPMMIQFGALCPDIPYLDEVVEEKFGLVAKQKIWGDLMHYVHTGKFLQFGVEMLKSMKEENSTHYEICLQWFLGFLSHMIVDTVIHPIVELKVGDYANNATQHRICEMHQDVWLFEEIYKKPISSIKPVESIEVLKRAEVLDFWEYLLSKCYGFYLSTARPNFHEWINDYRQKLAIASNYESAIGKNSGLFYPNYEAINPEFLKNLDSPVGKIDFDQVIYTHMIPNIVKFWQIVFDGIDNASMEYKEIFDFNMDSGKFIRTERYVSWEN